MNFVMSFLVLWFLISIQHALEQVAIWQQKEYRWDRMREYISLQSTHKKIFNPLYLLDWILLVLYLLGVIDNTILVKIIFVLLFVRLLAAIYAWRKGAFLRPVKTTKSILLVVLNVVILFFLPLVFASFFSSLRAAVFLLTNIFAFVVVAATVASFYPVSRYFKERTILKAKELRTKFPGVCVIGITGSYGKTSTKNILATILDDGNKVAATKGNINTEIGVASELLKKLSSELKFFIVELGAYKKGEIAKLSAITQPSIGIITAVTNQHLGLFGSLDNIRDAKYELIMSLPSTGTAIFNADDPIANELADKTRHCRVLKYGITNKADLQAQILSVNEDGIRAKIYGIIPDTEIFVPLLGVHQLQNVLAAVCAAYVVEQPMEKVVEKLKSIKPVKGTMKKIEHESGALIIDDSYNANTVGVLAAINTLKSVKRQKKIIVLTPLIELGQNAASEHEKIGSVLTSDISKIYFCGTDNLDDLKRGMGNANKLLITEKDPVELFKKISAELDPNTALLIEGRVPRLIRERIVE